MINILIEKKSENILALSATGHSGYAEAGSDIVCSAVSTLTENLILSLKEVLAIAPIYEIDEQKPALRVELHVLSEKKMREAQILMKSTVLGLKDVAKSYKKYIKIKNKYRISDYFA